MPDCAVEHDTGQRTGGGAVRAEPVMYSVVQGCQIAGFSPHLEEETAVRPGWIVGGQIRGDQEEFRIIWQLDVSVSRQTCSEK